MKVKEVMTKDVVTLNQFASLREAAETLAKNGISGAPVVGTDGELIGILTEADILRAVGGSADRVKMVYPSLHTMGVFFEMSRGEIEILKAFEEQANSVVGDAMTKKVITCVPNDDLNEVARQLYMKSINRVPVVDGEGHVVGIVTRGDIVRAFCVQGGVPLEEDAEEEGKGPAAGAVKAPPKKAAKCEPRARPERKGEPGKDKGLKP
jgi:CBS domain-containing protein